MWNHHIIILLVTKELINYIFLINQFKMDFLYFIITMFAFKKLDYMINYNMLVNKLIIINFLIVF